MSTGFHGVEASFYGAGYDLKPYFKDISVSGERSTYDASSLNDAWAVFRNGRVNGELSGEGLHSTGVGEFSTIVEAIHGTRQVAMLAPEGEVAGGLFAGIDGSVVTRGIDTKLTDMTMAVMNIQAKSGADLGYMLTAGKDTITATGFSSAVDTLVSDTRGGSFYFQCLDYVGTAAKLVVGLEDSADNVTFAAISGTEIPAASIVETYNTKIVIPDGTTMRRYVRAYWTVTAGLTTADIACGFCKYYT